jgi:DNA-binding transcriptional regulator YdaS (Cro superfamily)
MAEPVITQICDHFDGQASLARKLGVEPPTVNEWATGKRKVPDARCPELERLSEGKFFCEAIRPDIPWLRVADPKWPWHRRGRPVIDVTKAA